MARGRRAPSPAGSIVACIAAARDLELHRGQRTLHRIGGHRRHFTVHVDDDVLLISPRLSSPVMSSPSSDGGRTGSSASMPLLAVNEVQQPAQLRPAEHMVVLCFVVAEVVLRKTASITSTVPLFREVLHSFAA